MMRIQNLLNWLSIALLCFVITAVFYNALPSKIVMHWNASGFPDRLASKEWLFLTPFTILFLTFLFSIIPFIDPLSKNFARFEKYYNVLVLALLAFLFYIQCLVILWNAGFKVSISVFVLLGVSALFFITGLFLQHVKQNWFVGVRTPWTLSNDKVWFKTNRFVGRCFQGLAFLFIILSMLPLLNPCFSKHVFLTVVVLTLTVAAISVVYSYIAYRKILKQA
ncbi:SdpI family protein [Candidatus Woesearchaeota archaeon]|nr:SdpI family protein [Candidatus Woesearchaeota archaeon]